MIANYYDDKQNLKLFIRFFNSFDSSNRTSITSIRNKIFDPVKSILKQMQYRIWFNKKAKNDTWWVLIGKIGIQVLYSGVVWLHPARVTRLHHCWGANEAESFVFKFLPWPGFDPRTSQSNGRERYHSTTTHPVSQMFSLRSGHCVWLKHIKL